MKRPPVLGSEVKETIAATECPEPREKYHHAFEAGGCFDRKMFGTAFGALQPHAPYIGRKAAKV